MDALRLANTAFALDVFKKLFENSKTDNIIFSPLCLSTSLALAANGANGNNATEFGKVLHIEKVKDCDFGFQSLNSDVSKLSCMYSIKMVKRLYVESSLDCTKNFVDSAKKRYPLELELIDIKKQPEEARNKINTSIKELTDGKFETLLNEGTCDENSKMLLVGAAYFSGSWMYKFNSADTKEVEFHTSKTETKPVQMMNIEARLSIGYIKGMEMTILDIPYNIKLLDLLILLPNSIEDDSTGLEKLENNITCENFVHWTNPSMMASSKVKLCLPKFKMECSFDFIDTLKSLGLIDAFNEKTSDFSCMSESKGIVLSQALQKACIEINEEGTESPDVTKERLLMHKDEFLVNRPFLFMLRHTKTRSLLMCGRYCTPP